jgi:hypothetical protein
LPCNVGERSGAPADLYKPFHPCRIDIESNDAKSGGDQALRVHFSHQAETDQTDGWLRRHGCSFLRLGDLLE